MSPMMWHGHYSDYLPLPEVYEYVMKQLDEDQYDSKQKEKAKKLRDEVIGNSWMKSTPDLYWDISILIDLGITPYDWRNTMLWNQVDRAKWRAYKFVESMSQTVQRYNDYVKEQQNKTRERQAKAEEDRNKNDSKGR